MAKPKIPVSEKENIKRLYLEEKLGTIPIAEMYGVADGCVARFLKRHDIPIRTLEEANKLVANNPDTQDKRRKKLCGKPSWSKGKTWKLKHRKFSPNMLGEKNPRWKGGKTKLGFLVRNLPEYREWRTKVYQRDDYTCVQCGARCKKGQKVILECDHINPLSVLLSQYNITKTADAITCEALWDINNGRTMCRKCHRKTKTYGVNLIRNKCL